MTVSVSDVRAFLGDISEEELSDGTIQKQIDLATQRVNSLKSSQATDSQVDAAVLALAGYYSYLAYAQKLERGTGVTPPYLRYQLEAYKEQVEDLLSIVKAGDPSISIPFELPTSLYDKEEQDP